MIGEYLPVQQLHFARLMFNPQVDVQPWQDRLHQRNLTRLQRHFLRRRKKTAALKRCMLHVELAK